MGKKAVNFKPGQVVVGPSAVAGDQACTPSLGSGCGASRVVQTGLFQRVSAASW